MLKKILFLTLLFTAACASTQNRGKTPETIRGQLNRCMLDRVYDLKAQNRPADADKWTTAREILGFCKRSLHISGSEINDTQSLNIIVSAIDSLNEEPHAGTHR